MALGHNAPDYKPNDQYFTPKDIFDALGVVFDTDPAHPPYPTSVPCKTYFCEADDGLAQEWKGLVWCNPPYSKPRPWIEKFIQHRNGIMLIQISKSKAFDQIWKEADAVCVPGNGATFKFDLPDGTRKGIFMPVMLLAMGEEAVAVLKNSGLGRVR